MKIELTKYSKANCRPCFILNNALNTLALADHGATITEIDVSGLSDSSLDALKLSGVPTLIARRNGVEVARKTGVMSPEEIIDLIETAKEAR